jgi:hypothetical protein
MLLLPAAFTIVIVVAATTVIVVAAAVAAIVVAAVTVATATTVATIVTAVVSITIAVRPNDVIVLNAVVLAGAGAVKDACYATATAVTEAAAANRKPRLKVTANGETARQAKGRDKGK